MAWTPADLGADLSLWLDASDFADLADGTVVSNWADKSGNGNTVSQVGGTLTKRTLAGRPVLRGAGGIDSDLDRIGGAAQGMTSQNWTFALNHKAGAAGRGLIYWGRSDASSGIFIDIEAGSKLTLFNRNGAVLLQQTGALSTTALQTIVVTSTSGAQRMYVGGALDGSAAETSLAVWDFTPNPILVVGGWRDTQFSMDGDNADVVVVDRVITVDERAKLEGWLATFPHPEPGEHPAPVDGARGWGFPSWSPARPGRSRPVRSRRGR